MVNRKPNTICPGCDKDFYLRPSHARRRVRLCSQECKSSDKEIKRRLEEKRAVNRNGCWLWKGSMNSDGYGSISINKKLHGVHRASMYIYRNVSLEHCKSVLHKCDVRNCFNPSHLYLGSQRDNVRDCVKRGRMKTRLSIQDVRKIRRLLKTGMKQKEIGNQFGVRQGKISAIKTGRNWFMVTSS